MFLVSRYGATWLVGLWSDYFYLENLFKTFFYVWEELACSNYFKYGTNWHLTFRAQESHYNGSGKSSSVLVQSIVFRGFQGFLNFFLFFRIKYDTNWHLTFRAQESHYNGSGKSFSVLVLSIVFRGFQGCSLQKTLSHFNNLKWRRQDGDIKIKKARWYS